MKETPRAILLLLGLLTVGAGLSQPALAGVPASSTAVQGGDETGVYASFLDGHFAASQSDPAQAASDWLRALALDPANVDLEQQTFIQCLLSDRPEAAGLANRLPGNVVAQMLGADQSARNGNWADAEQRFAALAPDGIMTLLRPLLVAWSQQGAGHTDQALATLQPLTANRQLPGLYSLHAALIADLAGRITAAAAFYEAARVGDGTPPLRLAQLIGSFDARQNHEGAALQALDAVGDSAPLLRLALPAMATHLRTPPVADPIDGLAEAYVGFAAAVHQDGDDQFAEILLRLALDLRPDFAAARLLAADVMEAEHNLDGAIHMVNAVPDSDALAPVARVRAAELAARAGQPEQALRELNVIARAFPDSPLPDSEIGDVLRQRGDFSGAAQAYTRAIALTPTPSATDWPLFYDRAIAYSESGNWPLAQSDFEHALKLQPNQPLVMNYLGYSWADRGEHLAEARTMLETAAHLRPDDGAVIDSLGWVEFRQGDTADAVATLERAVELDPADATINGHLGDAYWAVGRKMEATYQWRRALIFNPAPADAAKLEAKLHETTAQATTSAARIP